MHSFRHLVAAIRAVVGFHASADEENGADPVSGLQELSNADTPEIKLDTG